MWKGSVDSRKKTVNSIKRTIKARNFCKTSEEFLTIQKIIKTYFKAFLQKLITSSLIAVGEVVWSSDRQEVVHWLDAEITRNSNGCLCNWGNQYIVVTFKCSEEALIFVLAVICLSTIWLSVERTDVQCRRIGNFVLNNFRVVYASHRH